MTFQTVHKKEEKITVKNCSNSKKLSKKLTDFTPMITSKILASNISNTVCNRPRITPRSRAIDAEGIFLIPLVRRLTCGWKKICHWTSHAVIDWVDYVLCEYLITVPVMQY